MGKSKNRTKKHAVVTTPPESFALATRGVGTATDFADLMGALMADVIHGRVSPQTAKAACNAGGKLLKVVEMQLKYGRTSDNGESRQLQLTSEK